MDEFDQIRSLREEYEAALDEADQRRADYHRAVKKLHLSGMPLRDIAEGLGISHQRVHQIVTGEIPRKRRSRKALGGTVAGLVLLLVAGSLIGTRLLSHRGHLVAVPDLVGMNAQAGLTRLATSSLCLSGIRQSGSQETVVTSPTTPSNGISILPSQRQAITHVTFMASDNPIASQEPSPGTLVPAGSPVTLTISPFSGQTGDMVVFSNEVPSISIPGGLRCPGGSSTPTTP